MSKTPISILQELMVAEHKGTPCYTTGAAPPSTGFTFQCTVTADGFKATGYANTKQNAKQNSAEKLLDQMGYPVVNSVLNKNSLSNQSAILSEQLPAGVNYVSKLNEFASGNNKDYPVYSDSVIPSNGLFSVTCNFMSNMTCGQGQTKKLAKQQAAGAMLTLLKDASFDNTVSELTTQKVNNIDRLTDEIIKRMGSELKVTAKNTQSQDTHSQHRTTAFLETEPTFPTLSDLIEYLAKKGHKCNFTTIQRDPCVMVMEIEGTSCSIRRDGDNHCRVMGHGPTKIDALEEIRRMTEFMIKNKFSFNISGNTYY